MTPIASLAQIFRTSVFALGRELAAWRPSRERAAFAAEAVVSVALSVALANALHLSNTWWAAISGFAVMQTRFDASMQRAAHRMVGTVIGAALGMLVGPWIGDRLWLFVPVLGLIGGVSIYRANGSDVSYAWVLGAITALMVTYEAHGLASSRSIAAFAGLRVAEVAVGTFACVLVSSVSHFTPGAYRKMRPRPVAVTEPVASPAPAGFAPSVAANLVSTRESLRPARRLLGAQGALAVASLATLTYVLNLPGFAQAMVTVITVLVLPVTVLMHMVDRPVIEKMVQRLAGCLLAGALGIALTPLLQGQAVLCLLALSAGVWIGCHVQSGEQGASYVGRQFTIAFIMVFVQDHRWSSDPVPALMRLAGILTGIVVVSAVMLATTRWLFRRRRAMPSIETRDGH